MDFDEVLSLVGDLGRYQRWLFVLLCVPASLPSVVSIFSHIFISAVPKHHCHPPVAPESASLLKNSLAASENYLETLNSLFIPRDAQGNFEKCHQYDIDINSVIDRVVTQNKLINATVVNEFVTTNRWPLVQCRHGWDYDRREYPETLATKLNVVCDQEWMISSAQSAFFVGGMIGCLFFGWYSDKMGRRPAFFLATALMVVGSIAEIYPPTYVAYIGMRFVIGLSYPSVYQLAFLIVAEMIGVSKRTSSAMVTGISFSLGMMLFAYLAHFISHWQALQAVTSIPLLLLIGYYWLVPESPRWLISQGRIDEAETIVQKMARVNGIPLPPNFLQTKLAEQPIVNTPCSKEPTQIGISHILRYPKVLRKLLTISTVWTITAMVYNGMSFAVPALASEAYIAFFLSGTVEIPGILFAWVAMERYGRNRTMFGTLFFAGVLSAATAFVPYGVPWLSVLLPSLSKLCISSTFTVIYMFAGELFPTVIRGVAIGVASTISQLGLVVTPYILYLGTIYGDTVPFVIFGVLSVLGALLMLTLPETLHAPLPTTMQEAEDYSDYVKTKKKDTKVIQSIAEKPETLAEHQRRKSSTLAVL